MRCDEVRERLTDYVLGPLLEGDEAAVRRHLRGCAGCRRELASLDDGLSTFARAVHQVVPPEPLKDSVLTVLGEEWNEPGARPSDRSPRRASWLSAAAAIAVVVGALAWGVVSERRADRYERLADKYTAFLEVLGGEDVRVGTLDPTGRRQLEGSVVLYDSKVEQSWVLVLVRAPGMEGEADVALSSSDRTIEMHPLEFGPGGEASTWLVTTSSLERFGRVTVTHSSGEILATATVRQNGPATA